MTFKVNNDSISYCEGVIGVAKISTSICLIVFNEYILMPKLRKHMQLVRFTNFK